MAASLRRTNSRIAGLYDELPYDPLPNALLEPDRLMGLAALYGCRGKIGDVLDIGCGTGVELARFAPLASGRLAGVDLSRSAVATAQERCRPFGARADIRCADLMDLDPKSLGQFDLILHFGVIFVVPPEVRSQILRLVAGCLAPGGVAVLSYYAGSMPTLRANLHRTLRAGHDPSRPPLEEVAKARAALQRLAERVPAAQPGRDLLMAAIEQTARQSDVIFFHEVLNHTFEALQTSQIEAAMAPAGVKFLSYLGENSAAAGASSADRAHGADTLDFMFGSYRHAVFGRPPADGPPDVRNERLEWRTPLRRKGDVDYASPGKFEIPGRGLEFTAGDAHAQALIDSLAEAPARWSVAVGAAHRRVTGQPGSVPDGPLQSMERDLLALLRLNAADPLVRA